MSSDPKFGTDGVRGIANSDLTPEFALRLGRAAGSTLSPGSQIVIGRDTRQSGPMLEAALAAGFNSVGIEVVRIGIAPTPAVAYVTRSQGYALGAVISASHNPAPDNGIKFFGPDGGKLPDAAEEAIVQALAEAAGPRPTGGSIGDIKDDELALDGYLDFLESLVPERLEGMTVAVDAAHGAAYELGPEILRRLGATVYEMGVSPDGVNINAEGGATKPESICDFTKSAGAEVGVAFDGDADRAVFSDANGILINGDRTIGIWSAFHQAAGELEPPVVIGTVMSNAGFERYLSDRGVKLVRVPVGDKYVSRELRATGSQVGGEQSGHIVFPRHAPSGDGLATMLELLRVLKRSGRDLATWVADYEPWPQVLFNLSVPNPKAWDASERVKATVIAAEAALGTRGRVNIRASGTQPILRLMVEADTYEARDAAADSIFAALRDEMGATLHGKVDLTHALGD